MAWKDIKKSANEWYRMTVAPEVKSFSSYSYAKEITAAVAIIVVAASVFWGYRSYYSHKEGSSQIALAQAIESYQATVSGGTITWPQLEMILQTSYEQNKQSQFAPYFLMYLAEAQIKQNKLSDAAATMEHVLSGLPKDSPLINLYKTKLALIGMDLSESATQQSSLEKLRALAYDKENRFNDYAMYYLGLFVSNQGNKQEAQKIWKELVESQRHEQRLAQSPWVILAKEKLAPCGDEVKL